MTTISFKPYTPQKSQQKLAFGRAYTTDEKAGVTENIQEAFKALGADGKKILIMHEPCLPQSATNNTGTGHLSSKESSDFVDFAKTYWGINHLETLPPGEITSSRKPESKLVPGKNKFYCAYKSTSMSLAPQAVNLEFLTGDDYGKILTHDDIKKVVDANKEDVITSAEGNKIPLANFENVAAHNSPHNEVLKTAFERFKALPEDSKIKVNFENYKKAPENAERLEYKSLFRALKKENGHNWKNWNETDKNLYEPTADKTKTAARIAELKENHKDNIELFKFKQFIADEHLQASRKKLNDKGIKLVGDCPINFSDDEVWAHPEAFRDKAKIGWGLPAIDYDKVRNPDGSLGESGKLMEKKFDFFFRRYDAVRFDVGWSYVAPKVKMPDGTEKHFDKTEEMVGIAEGVAKKIHKDKYDSNNLMYESEGHLDWTDRDNPKVYNELKDRVQIYTTAHMKDSATDKYGSVDFCLNMAKMNKDKVVIGVGNHDNNPLRIIAQNLGDGTYGGKRDEQIKPLISALKLEDTDEVRTHLSNPVEFAKAKFAELFTGAKHHMFFYQDTMGREETFDSQDGNTYENYRHKLTDKFEEEYHGKMQEHGHGLNLPDALAKAMKAQGKHETHKPLYENLLKMASVLMKKGAKSEKEANDTVKDKIEFKPLKIVGGEKPAEAVAESVSESVEELVEDGAKKADGFIERMSKHLQKPTVAVFAASAAVAALSLGMYVKNSMDKKKSLENS
jgi:hypothetical protein